MARTLRKKTVPRKDSKQLLASFEYQSLKSIAKVAKLVKAFLIQRILRQNDSSEPSGSGSDELQAIKNCDHVKMSKALYSLNLNHNDSSGEADLDENTRALLEAFNKHKRVKEHIKELKDK